MQSAVQGILQGLAFAGLNECDRDKWTSLWMYRYNVSVFLNWLFWASVICIFEWVRKGQLMWECLAEEGVLGRGSKRQQWTDVNVSLTPTLHPLSAFKIGPDVFPFLLALSKFSCTVKIILIWKVAQAYFFPFVEEDEALASFFQQICFPSFFRLSNSTFKGHTTRRLK